MLDTIPAELRNRVYFLTESLVPTHFHRGAMTFVDNGATIPPTLIENRSIVFGTNNPTLPQPAITRVCRKIREEALKIYYGNNPIHIRRHFGPSSDFFSRAHAGKLLAIIKAHGNKPVEIVFCPTFSDMAVVAAREQFGDDVAWKAESRHLAKVSSEIVAAFSGNGSGSSGSGNGSSSSSSGSSETSTHPNEEDADTNTDTDNDDHHDEETEEDNAKVEWDLEDDSELLYFADDNDESEDEDGDVMLYRSKAQRAMQKQMQIEDDVFTL